MSGTVFHVGVDHHLAPLDVRELVAQDADGVVRIARAVREEGWAAEAVLLSTCNRTELYVASTEPDGADLALGAWLRNVPGAPPPSSGCYRRHGGAAAALHLLRVASGLESAILGETEIQGQVRLAHERGRQAESLGPVLDRLFQAAIRTGKRARRETGISDGGASHGSAAAQVVRRVFDTLEGRQVLVVGAGQIATQAARTVADVGGGTFVVANRTQAHAETLAALLPKASVRGTEGLVGALADAHVAILATGADPLTVADIETAARKRREPLLLIDLGVPRCVAAAAGDVRGVFLYDLEALEQMVAGSLASRRDAVPAVESLVQLELDGFETWLRGRGAMPAVRSLHEWAESIRAAELAWLPDDMPLETRAAVEELTRRLVKRLLGRATARVVKGTGGEDPSLPTAADLKSLFGLDEGESR